MADVAKKVTLSTIGLLSKMELQYVAPEGYKIDIRYAQSNKAAATALETVGDLKKGIAIGPNVILRLSSQEDAELLQRFVDFTGRLRNELSVYVLESSIDIDSEPNNPTNSEKQDNLTTNIKNVVTAFRLLKPEFIEANIKIGLSRPNEHELYFNSDHGLYQNFTGFLYWDSSNTLYKLEISELPEVRALAERISAIDFTKRSALRIALDRFEKLYYERYLEDQLIDCMIAFEALLIGKKSRDQGSIIPVAAAMLLGKTEEERQEITDVMETAYNIRNCIVHGSDYQQKLSKKLEMATFTRNVESILRSCIKKLL